MGDAFQQGHLSGDSDRSQRPGRQIRQDGAGVGTGGDDDRLPGRLVRGEDADQNGVLHFLPLAADAERDSLVRVPEDAPGRREADEVHGDPRAHRQAGILPVAPLQAVRVGHHDGLEAELGILVPTEVEVVRRVAGVNQGDVVVERRARQQDVVVHQQEVPGQPRVRRHGRLEMVRHERVNLDVRQGLAVRPPVPGGPRPTTRGNTADAA